MRENGYIKKAKKFLELAKKEIEKSKKNSDPHIAVDGCAKGYLALDLATKGLFQKKGVKQIPKSYRGTRYLLQKYADKNLIRIFGNVRDILHIDGYYEQIINYNTITLAFEDLENYIKTIENLWKI